jgi:uncharacterized protein (DUF3084 family)
MNTSVYKNSTVQLSVEPSPVLQNMEDILKTDSETCSARKSDFEEKKVISLNEHKYSSTKKNKSPYRLRELTTRDFEEADQIQFKTYEEYNEEDFIFETVEEITIEEQEYEESTISRFNCSSRINKAGDRSSKVDDRKSKVDDRTSKVDDRTSKVDDRTSKVDDRTSKVDDSTSKVDDRTIKVDDRTSKVDDRTIKVDDRTIKVDDRTIKVDYIWLKLCLE